MRILLSLVIIISAGLARADVCFTDYQAVGDERTYDDLVSKTNEEMGFLLVDGTYIYESRLTCKEVDDLSSLMTASSIALQTAAFGAACTGVGLPATVYLEGGAIVFSVASLLVTYLDCEDPDNEEKMKALVDKVVCEKLQEQGVQCNPPLKQL